MKILIKLFLYFLLLATFLFRISTHAENEDAGIKKLKTPLMVSMVNLIATPERYEGKFVSVTGYATIEFEDITLCLSERKVTFRECIWIDFYSGPFDSDEDIEKFKIIEKEWHEKYNRKYINIRGNFKMYDENFGLYVGTIKDIEGVVTSD